MRPSHRDAANALIASATQQAAATGLAKPPEPPVAAAAEPQAAVEVALGAAPDSAPRPKRAAKAPTAYGFTVPRSAVDTDQTVQLGLRIPRRLHAALKAAAYLHDKSIQDLASEAIVDKLLLLGQGADS